MRDDHRRFRLSGMDQLAQASVIGLDVRLSGGNALHLDPEIAEVESELAFLGELVCAARIFWYEYTDDADAAGGLHRLHQIVHRQIGHLLAMHVAALVTDAFAAAIRALPTGQVQYLLHAAALVVVNGDRANLFSQFQTILVRIDNKHLARALDEGRRGGHQSDRPGTVHHDGVARLDARQFGRMEARGEDIRQHDIVVLLFPGVLGQHQTVIVAVWTHAREAVRSACIARIHGQAVAGQATFAVCAKATTNIEWKANHVADLDAVDRFADHNDFSQVFVTQDAAALHVGSALVHMQIGAADICRCDPYQNIGLFFDLRVRHFLHLNVARTVIYKCFHVFLLYWKSSLAQTAESGEGSRIIIRGASINPAFDR